MQMSKRMDPLEIAAIIPGFVTWKAGSIGTIFGLQVKMLQRVISSYVLEQFVNWQGIRQFSSSFPLKNVTHISSNRTSMVQRYASQFSDLKKSKFLILALRRMNCNKNIGVKVHFNQVWLYRWPSLFAVLVLTIRGFKMPPKTANNEGNHQFLD